LWYVRRNVECRPSQKRCGMAYLSLISVALTTFQDHLGAYNAIKHLKSLSLPDASYLGMGYHPPRCGNAYFHNSGLREKLRKQRKEIIAHLMHRISIEVVKREGSTL